MKDLTIKPQQVGILKTIPLSGNCYANIGYADRGSQSDVFYLQANGQVSKATASLIQNEFSSSVASGKKLKVSTTDGKELNFDETSFPSAKSIYDVELNWEMSSETISEVKENDNQKITSESAGLGLLNAALVLKACQENKLSEGDALLLCPTAANTVTANYNFINAHPDKNKLMHKTCDTSENCTGGSDTNADLYIAGAEQILFNIQGSKPSQQTYLPKLSGLTQQHINEQLTNIKNDDFVKVGKNYVATLGDNHDQTAPMLAPDKAVLPLMQMFNSKDTWTPYIQGDLNYLTFEQQTMVPGFLHVTKTNGLIVGGINPDQSTNNWPQMCSASSKGNKCYTETGQTIGAQFPAKSTVATLTFGRDSIRVPYYLGLYANMASAKDPTFLTTAKNIAQQIIMAYTKK